MNPQTLNLMNKNTPFQPFINQPSMNKTTPLQKVVNQISMNKPVQNNQPSQPVMNKPVVNQPSQPVMNKQSQPIMNKPVMNQQSQPVMNKPVVNQPSQPVMNKPVQNNQSSQPVMNKPVQNNQSSQPVMNKPVMNKPVQNNQPSQHVMKKPVQNNQHHQSVSNRKDNKKEHFSNNNTCNKTSNNKYFECPALMEDGRAFTDYRPSSDVENMIQYSNNIMSSYEYRQFLINNANKIMDVNTMYASNKLSCNDCNTPDVPFNTVCNVNSKYSRCQTVNPNGIGIYYNTI
jgi:hypothetical protein